jgi:hypothetical protein
MLRSICVFLGSVVLAVAAVGAEPDPDSALGKGIRVPSNLGIATNVSPDAQAATILFDNLRYWRWIRWTSRLPSRAKGRTSLPRRLFGLRRLGSDAEACGALLPIPASFAWEVVVSCDCSRCESC